MLTEVGKLPHVADVADPFTARGSVSADGQTAYATVTLDVAAADMPAEDVRTIIDKAQEIDGRRPAGGARRRPGALGSRRAAGARPRARESLLRW